MSSSVTQWPQHAFRKAEQDCLGPRGQAELLSKFKIWGQMKPLVTKWLPSWLHWERERERERNVYWDTHNHNIVMTQLANLVGDRCPCSFRTQPASEFLNGSVWSAVGYRQCQMRRFLWTMQPCSVPFLCYNSSWLKQI